MESAAREAGAPAEQAAVRKIKKYSVLSQSSAAIRTVVLSILLPAQDNDRGSSQSPDTGERVYIANRRA